MEERASMQRAAIGTALLLVTGLPGVGKSTFASSVAGDLGAAVIGHDVVMAALRSHPRVWASMRQLDRIEFRTIGWSVMWNLAQSELREGRSVILDRVARDREIERTRQRAEAEGAASIVVLCELASTAAQRARIEGRTRGIAGWPELKWQDVERARHGWARPRDVDLVIDCAQSVDDNRQAFFAALATK